MRRVIPNTVRFILLAVLCSSLTLEAADKKRVAVLDFEYGTVYSGVAAIFGANVDIGKGISDVLVEKLLKGGQYSVVERTALDKVLQEQNFSNSDRANPATAAQIGRVLGVDALIIGTITQFGRDDRAQKVGGGVLGSRLGRFGVGGVETREAKAQVAVSARLVSTDTAEILAAVTGKGSSKRSGTSLLGAGGSSDVSAGAATDMTTSNFAGTLIGEAVHEAVDAVARQLDAQAGGIPDREVEVSGLVADVDGNTLILNVGSEAGVKVGDRLAVKRKVRDVKDPSTGAVIRSIENEIGVVVITEVDARSSIGSFAGEGQPKVGDSVRN
jgi:curli biogenesis system outer membrane secretion channel CsgG